YYTNYFGLIVHFTHLAEMPVVIWRNLDGYLSGVGKLFFFDTSSSILLKQLSWVVAIAAIAGVVQLVRRTGLFQYAAFALGFTMLHLVWQYPPDSRFVLPLFT